MCPRCGGGFREVTSPARGNGRPGGSRSLVCPEGHTFDIARQGYVNLLSPHSHRGTADTADMVEARDAFLRGGSFEPLSSMVAEEARICLGEETSGCVVDVGAGTGYYLVHVLDRLSRAVGLALDLSVYAARRAARAHPRMGAVVCDAWGALPVCTVSADLVLSVFSPRNPSEFRRILRPDGVLLVAAPNRRHLHELVRGCGLLSVDEHKEERLAAALGGLFTHERARLVEQNLTLTRAEAVCLVGMGPSARHLEKTAVEECLSRLAEPLSVTMSIAVRRYRPL